jgi:hypothetical protein
MKPPVWIMKVPKMVMNVNRYNQIWATSKKRYHKPKSLWQRKLQKNQRSYLNWTKRFAARYVVVFVRASSK